MTNQSTTTTTITSTDSSLNQELIDSIKDPITKNIETISSLHIQESSNVSNHQQILESIALFFGQPIFLYLLLVLFAIWISDNFLASLVPFDLPKFRWTDDGLGAASLIISTGVLIRQTRQEKLAEQRSQLTLHLDLLVEQKTAKIISLLEELRTDLPNVDNRHDQEAHMMKEVADPIAVLEAIQETLTQELSAQELSAQELSAQELSVHESSTVESQDSAET